MCVYMYGEGQKILQVFRLKGLDDSDFDSDSDLDVFERRFPFVLDMVYGVILGLWVYGSWYGSG